MEATPGLPSRCAAAVTEDQASLPRSAKQTPAEEAIPALRLTEPEIRSHPKPSVAGLETLWMATAAHHSRAAANQAMVCDEEGSEHSGQSHCARQCQLRLVDAFVAPLGLQRDCARTSPCYFGQEEAAPHI